MSLKHVDVGNLRSSVATLGNALTPQSMERSVVSQIWIYHRDTRETHHVLSQVDLVPDELPFVDCPDNWREHLAKKGPWSVHCENWVVETKCAIDWYDKLVHLGVWDPSWRTPPLTKPIALEGLLNEPRWPTLVLSKETYSIPISKRRDPQSRCHHVLVERPRIRELLPAKELERLEVLMHVKADVDFSTIPELWQSTHLFQSPPVLRSVSTRLDSSDETGDQAVLIDLAPRMGGTLDGLEIFVKEHRTTGQRLLARFRPESHFIRLPLLERVGSISIQVFHDEHGLIFEEGPYGFVRKINFRSGVVGRERRVSLKKKGDQAEEVLRIPVISESTFSIGASDPEASAANVLLEIEQRLKFGALPSDNQRWFNGDINEATEAVRAILARSQSRALIVDPYFNAGDARLWLPSIAREGAKIELLTSKDGMKQRTPDKQTLLDQLEALQAEIRKLSNDRLINPIDVRVMSGQNIHDRFLVADSTIWLLGSSLNNFGSRGTMLVQLQFPLAVLPELDREWNDSTVLEQMISDLQIRNQESEK